MLEAYDGEYVTELLKYHVIIITPGRRKKSPLARMVGYP